MNRVTAVLLTVGGVAMAVVGGIALCSATDDKQKQLSGMVKGKTKRGGMTTSFIYKKDLDLNKRLAIIQDLTWKSVQDPRMRQLALAITQNCPERDGTCEARAVYRAVKDRVRYTGDVGKVKQGSRGIAEEVDLYQSAYRTWEFGGGDCDDNAILSATLLTLNGIDAEFRVIAPSPDPTVEDWQHIYAVANLPKNNPTRKIALDTTLPGSNNFGVEPNYGKRRDFVA